MIHKGIGHVNVAIVHEGCLHTIEWGQDGNPSVIYASGDRIQDS